MATYAQIEAEVMRIVEDRITALDSAIVTHVARAQRAIENRCAFPVQWAEATYRVEPLTSDYAKPADFIAVRKAPYFLERADAKRYNKLTELDTFEDLGLLTEQGVPKYWREKDDASLQFWPIGDGSGPSLVTPGAYDVSLLYFKTLSGLAAESDTNWWSVHMDDVLAWRAASFVYAELRDPMANWWSAVAAARFMEVRKQQRYGKLRQKETRIYPAESLSSSTQKSQRPPRTRWVSEIP